jgi:hypothetical protein
VGFSSEGIGARVYWGRQAERAEEEEAGEVIKKVTE